MNMNIPQIPLKEFFKNSEKSSFKLSPDGKNVSCMIPWEDGNRMKNIYLININTNEIKRLTEINDRSIYGYMWASNDVIVFIKDSGGDENMILYSINIHTKEVINLTPLKNVKTQLIDDLEDDDEHILIGTNERDSTIFDVYKMNILSGKSKMVAKNPGNIEEWITDHNGNIRVAKTSDGVNTSMLYREDSESDFETIITTNFKEECSPLLFTPDNKNIYVSSNRGERDKSGIYIFNIEEKTEVDLLYENEFVDVSNIIYSTKQKKILGYTYENEKIEYHFIDENREKLQNELEKKVNSRINITSKSRDESKIIFITYSDLSKGIYYYYDIENDNLIELANMSNELNPQFMCEMKPIVYKSRDNIDIHGYLTLPKNRESKNLPIIVNPHGGPWARDSWGFNSEVQFFANRGYGVLQMNFRGSVGFGRNFWEISFKQWGKTMQHDITDGVNWLINEGIADPDRIAIYGASYGGYATLAGLTFTPDLYKCGIDYVGVSNIFTLLETLPPYWELGRQMMYEMIGNPENEKDLLREVSPLFHAEKIKVPLLVAQGANDPRVKQSESEQIVEACKNNNINYRYILKENEGHGFYNEENRFDFYEEALKFLNENL